jgi:hypothetical protein
MGEKLLNLLDNERAYHQEKENSSTTSWDRGFHNGSATEICRIRVEVMGFIKKVEALEKELEELKGA